MPTPSGAGEHVVPFVDSPDTGSAPVDALAAIKQRAGKALFDRLGARLTDPVMSEDQRQIAPATSSTPSSMKSRFP